MHGEDPNAFRGQHEQQRSRQGRGRQPGGEQWQGGGRQPQEEYRPPQGGTQRVQGTSQRGSQMGLQGDRTGQQPRMGQQGMQGQMGQQAGQTGRQGRRRGRATGQQGQAGQRGAQFGGATTGQAGQRGGMGQQGGQMAGQGQQGMQPAGTQAGMAGRQVGSAPSTRGVEMQSVTLEEVSRTEVVTVGPDESIANVVVEMADRDVGSVVVVEDDEPIGVLTDRKIALSVGETPNVADRTAGELVYGDLVTGTPGMTVYDAVRKMREAGVRRLPILDGDGQLDAIVALDDLIVLIAGELGAAAEVIEQQAPPR